MSNIEKPQVKKLVKKIVKKKIIKRKPKLENVDTSSKDKILNMEGLSYLSTIKDRSVDLVLTDPPYITSRKTGMDIHAKNAKKCDEENSNTKTEDDWNKFKTEEYWDKWLDDNNIALEKRDKKLDELKRNYIKYGSIYGKKYAVVTDYGDWDNNFTMEKLGDFIKEYYRVLKNGGTFIVFFDIWKITLLKEIMESAGFKQIRFIEWIKTNPQPLNSKINYLTNCREIALCGIKKSKPTFNSKYDNGIYMYPLQGGKNRIHPTQKSLNLFEDLIKKHSNEGDIVLDTFLGSGTTALAAKNNKRKYMGCEISKEYYDKIIELITKIY